MAEVTPYSQTLIDDIETLASLIKSDEIERINKGFLPLKLTPNHASIELVKSHNDVLNKHRYTVTRTYRLVITMKTVKELLKVVDGVSRKLSMVFKVESGEGGWLSIPKGVNWSQVFENEEGVGHAIIGMIETTTNVNNPYETYGTINEFGVASINEKGESE